MFRGNAFRKRQLEINQQKNAVEEKTDDQNVSSRKRTRRSGRTQSVSKDSNSLTMNEPNAKALVDDKGDSGSMNIGPDHQADVPTFSAALAEKVQAESMQIESKLVFTCDGFGGDAAVAQYMSTVELAVMQRDGVPLSPLNEERALTAFTECKGNISAARKLAMPRITRDTRYPGAGARWTNKELCLLARALSERQRDFQYISRNILQSRSTRELVTYYYTRHKQQGVHFGGKKPGIMFDRGIETTPRLRLIPELQVRYLHSLAVSAGDGFPPERRMRDAVLHSRQVKLKLVHAQRVAQARAQIQKYSAESRG